MAAKRKHRSTNEYLKYLRGELSPEERYSFERDLEADAFEREAMEGRLPPLSGAGSEVFGFGDIRWKALWWRDE